MAISLVVSGCGPGLFDSGEQPLAHRKHVSFGLSDASTPPSSAAYILPRAAVSPYVQWGANDGYCGELSLIEAGMGAGQWTSQFNSRLVCGAGLSQSGPDGFCAEHGVPNYNAQLLLEAPRPGDQPYAAAATCLANAHLAAAAFDYSDQAAGIPGYRQFMSWVKTHVIAGETVVIGVLNRGSDDPQYDHEVTVAKIGTNHSPLDPTYYDDDVLYFEDHGSGGPAFDQGYAFGALANSRAGANAAGANAYSILIPGGDPVYAGTGGDGIHVNERAVVPANYGFAVSGPADVLAETLPIGIKILGSSTRGVPNRPVGEDGFNFETPAIGQEQNSECTNVAPTWMTVTLEATVSGLSPGTAYNLYEYDFASVTGDGPAAALSVPDDHFNENAGMAKKATRFVAASSTYIQTVAITSDQTVVFRCVPADAP